MIEKKYKLTFGIGDEPEVWNMKNPETWPTQQHMGLDNSQYEALKLALENNLTLIQGFDFKIFQFFIIHNYFNDLGLDRPELVKHSSE